MYKFKILLFLLVPLSIFSQTQKDTNSVNFENQWLTLAKDWSYQKGDNIEWAQPNFDDSSWKVMTSENLNMPDGTAIADDNEIVWFRKRIKIDSLFTTDFVLDVYQQGASEIYLDGIRIHKLGTVSTNPAEIINQNPGGAFQSLQLVQGKEHLLAIRYVNSQYKYPKDARYTNTNGYIQLWATTLNFANKARVFNVSDSILNNRWTTNARYWRHQIGDNPDWAKPDFDDSSWIQKTGVNLNLQDGKPISDDNKIVWFRRPIKIDSTFTGAIVLKLTQTGASEIYLDGKRIHKLGNVSSNPDSLVSRNPEKSILSLHVTPGKKQILAIRFINATSKFPIYSQPHTGIVLQLASLDYATTNGLDQDIDLIENQNVLNNYYIVLGVALFMSVLFLCYFMFFPNEKINGYFALASLFFSFFILSIISEFDDSIFSFKNDLFQGISVILYLLITLFCIYKILNRKFGVFFWFNIILGLVCIPLLFLFRTGYIGPALALFIFLEIIRISIKSLKSERIGALIFLSLTSVSLLYWLFALLDILNILTINNIYKYQVFAQVLTPLSIAIYLGFIFGKKSKSLRLNLERVQKLSKEKESILAKQNETLEVQVKERTASLNTSLNDLKAAQSQLIQSEKMASLGELTAGIAHEIQNPLNFVNNFSEVSNELIDEMNEELDKGDIEEAKFIASDIKQNLEKINHHGKRADGIVKGMLQHSRSNTGKKEPTNINALADEYLRLAYHGLRAKDKEFNADMETDFDSSIKTITIIPQDIGRVILNLVTNAFYAVNEKSKVAKASEDYNYKPHVSITTKKKKNSLEITVKDNGNGMPSSVKEKIFQPFFTTKPTGQGTGLGLSMSYDIVTKGHGGELIVETEEGVGTEFTIVLPTENQFINKENT